MVGAQRLLADGERALVERLGLGVAALGAIELGQVVERGADIGVVGAQRLLADGERALVERLGLGVAALVDRAGQVLSAVPTSGWSGPAPSRDGERACRAARPRRSGPGR